MSRVRDGTEDAFRQCYGTIQDLPFAVVEARCPAMRMLHVRDGLQHLTYFAFICRDSVIDGQHYGLIRNQVATE